MRTVKQDRAILKRLVESYGKVDVVKFVKHINEEEDNEGYEEDDDRDPARDTAVDKHIKAYEKNIGPIKPRDMRMLRTIFYSLYSEGYFYGRKSYYDEHPQYVNLKSEYTSSELKHFFNADDEYLILSDDAPDDITEQFFCLPATQEINKCPVRASAYGKYWNIYDNDTDTLEKVFDYIGFDVDACMDDCGDLGEVFDPTLGTTYEDAISYLAKYTK